MPFLTDAKEIIELLRIIRELKSEMDKTDYETIGLCDVDIFELDDLIIMLGDQLRCKIEESSEMCQEYFKNVYQNQGE